MIAYPDWWAYEAVKANPAVVAVPVRSPIIADVKVFCPANVWFDVETKPVAPDPAIGILNVCVSPKEEIFGKSPE